MDAVDFVKNYIRMCAKVDGCEQCPCYKTTFCTMPGKLQSPEIAKDVVRLVEAWTAVHPTKTRQSVFLEQWPEARIDKAGILEIFPCEVCTTLKNKRECCASDFSCNDCRREFWMQEADNG